MRTSGFKPDHTPDGLRCTPAAGDDDVRSEYSMRYYLVLGFVTGVISVALIYDRFIGIILGVPVLLVLSIMQALALAVIKRRSGRPHRYAAFTALPALAFLLAVGLNLSVWAAKRDIFELVSTVEYPGSVEDFTFVEDAWTDYTVRFFCRISPKDFSTLISQSNFHLQDSIFSPKSIEIMIPDCAVSSIENPLIYQREIKNGFCILYADEGHDLIYAIYSVD